MNNYIGEVRKRSQNLLIVEGKHEKDELFKLLFQCFPEMKISMDDIWIYGTNIYMLYDDIVKEYGEEWEKDAIEKFFEYPQRLNDLLKEHFEISDDEKREECCEKILTIESDEDIHGQLHGILSGIINEKWADTANYQLEHMIKKVKYVNAGQTYWNYMRDVFRQIILHNIFKAIRVQYNIDIIDKKECRDGFQK